MHLPWLALCRVWGNVYPWGGFERLICRGNRSEGRPCPSPVATAHLALGRILKRKDRFLFRSCSIPTARGTFSGHYKLSSIVVKKAVFRNHRSFAPQTGSTGVIPLCVHHPTWGSPLRQSSCAHHHQGRKKYHPWIHEGNIFRHTPRIVHSLMSFEYVLTTCEFIFYIRWELIPICCTYLWTSSVSPPSQSACLCVAVQLLTGTPRCAGWWSASFCQLQILHRGGRDLQRALNRMGLYLVFSLWIWLQLKGTFCEKLKDVWTRWDTQVSATGITFAVWSRWRTTSRTLNCSPTGDFRFRFTSSAGDGQFKIRSETDLKDLPKRATLFAVYPIPRQADCAFLCRCFVYSDFFLSDFEVFIQMSRRVTTTVTT